MVVRWNSIRDHLPYNGSVYLMLTKNFRNLEQFEDEDSCYYQYRREKQSRMTNPVQSLADRMVWLSCGWGVRPSYTIALSLLVILFFTGIFWAGHALEFDSAEASQSGVALKDALYFSAMIFLGRAPQNLRVLGDYEYLTVVETLTGWILMALFLVTLSKVMLR